MFLSEPASGEEEDEATDGDYEYQVGGDEGSETEYENARDANSSGVSTPQYPGGAGGASPEAPPSFLQQAAAAAAASAATGDGAGDGSRHQTGDGAAPRGLPNLPARPRGPTLPPRPGTKSAGGGAGGSSSEPTGERDAPGTGASTAGAAAPQLPPRPVVASQVAAAAPAAAAPATPVEESEKVKKVRRQVQAFRTNIFRAALRLRYPTRSAMLQQLMYRLNMAERIHLQSAPGAGPQDPEGQAQMDAERAEVLHEPMDFSCSVLVLGLSGVGKTTTLYNLLGMEPLSGYHPTDSVQVLRGEVSGIPVTFIDTPGLQAGPGAMAANLKKLHSCKRAWNKYKPHAVLYLDRMDHGRRDQADLPVMRAVTDILGPDAWFSTVLTLTHAGAPPPDGPNGQPLANDVYYQQRGGQVQHVARQVTQDQRLMNPVALVENSPNCPKSEDGEPVLPNGTPWRRQLLMLCFTTKVLNEANAVLKPGAAGGKQAGGGAGAGGMMNPYMGMKIPPMGWLLSRLVDFRGPRKSPEDEREIKHDDEINNMPPAEKAAALRRKRMYLKQKAEESRQPEATVPIPAPEPQMGPSFDSDISSHHFRVMEDPAGILVRPIVSDAGVDHEDGVDSVHIEKQLVLRPKGQYLGGVPFLGYCQVTKDKQQFAFQSQIEGSHHTTSKWASTAEINAQTIGSDVLYTSRMESRLKTGRRNKITAGLIASKLGEDFSHPFHAGALAYGAKLDERIKITPNAKLRGSVGRVYTKAGAAIDHGTAASADLKLRPGGDPTTRFLLGTSGVWQKRDSTIAGNIATEFRLPKSTGRGGKSDTIMSANASYNNKGNGQIACRVNSHDYPQLALSMAVPVLKAVWDRLTAKEDF